jgi:tRNA G10  N-methylase Trm11
MQAPLYFFILGRNPSLSLAELNTLLPQNWEPVACSSEILIVNCPTFNLESLIKRLGGTIKIGKIVQSNLPLDVNQQINFLTELILKEIPPIPKKMSFGVSIYSLSQKTISNLAKIKERERLGLKIKRLLQKEGYKIRFVTSKSKSLSSVIVKKEKLLPPQGIELALFYGEKNVYLGQTLAVQEFEEASKRDFGRPFREMKTGLLPLQLAKIMINLASQPLSATLLDPFCGFGTILSEALLMGYTSLIGADLNPQMISATQKNIEWLKKHFPLPNFHLQLFPSDVSQLSQKLPLQSIDAIITEPYLGPVKIKNLPMDKLKQIANQLTTLYQKAFQEFKKILKPEGRIVFIFPVFQNRQHVLKLSSLALPFIKELGFKPQELIPEKLLGFNLNLSSSFLYSRPGQTVGREIFVFSF